MRTLHVIVLITLSALCSCEVAPFVTDHPDGSTTASMGGVFAARRKNVVAYIKTRNGNIIKFGSEEESGAIVQGVVTHGASKIFGHSEDLKTVTNGKVEIGKQGVEMFKEGETTKRILGTFVPPVQ